MKPVGGGWYEAEVPVGAGTAYRYRLEDGRAVPDPAARAQHGDVHDPSLVVDPLAYRWRHAEWRGRSWHETVLYELHVGTFGGFVGVERQLPRLAELGITAIELMPVAEFPGRRNWGYDGVLPFAPDSAYGTPEDLKSLVDAAHGLGLMVFLDVVYNHFGPDGNYIAGYAPQMFREDVHTPWGAAIDFRVEEVRRYFTGNALYWLMEYRFDGLRFDAAHAIADPRWLDEMAAEVRCTVEPGRQVHLVLEHDGNDAAHLAPGRFDAQWNDDAHHVCHVLLTGERDGYYTDYLDQPSAALAKCLAEGFLYQGQHSEHRGAARGTPSYHLPPTAFVFFLQNHDQIGNRARGERLRSLVRRPVLDAAVALQLLCPQIPLIFMGEETGSRDPFFFFTDHNDELAEAVRKGRRREFAKFGGFSSDELPDPNAASTFEASIPRPDPAEGDSILALYKDLLRLRREEIQPRLPGTTSLAATAIGPDAVIASWRLGDGAVLTLVTNLGDTDVGVEPPRGRLLFGPDGDHRRSPPASTRAYLEAPG
jgi:maltooligosyltrehalose trehalohydrolase